MSILQYATMQTPGGIFSQYPYSNVQNQQGASALSPLFGRPGWTYVSIQRSPQLGPTPHLAQGSGHTNPKTSLPGNSAQLPGYLTDNEYFPTQFGYLPEHQPSFCSPIPRSIRTGDDGVELMGTYRVHDFTPADRFFNQARQAATWQVQQFPPNYRNLLAWQQVQRYRVSTLTQAPRVLDPSNYFLGYQVSSAVIGDIGQNTLGSMGSQ